MQEPDEQRFNSVFNQRQYKAIKFICLIAAFSFILNIILLMVYLNM